MAIRGCRAQANQPVAASERDMRDIEMDDLRRQIQHLQEHLERYQAFEHDALPHGSDVQSSSDDGTNINPFH